jgi:protein-disulfide isomerase
VISPNDEVMSDIQLDAASGDLELQVPIEPRDHAQGPADAPVTLVEYGDYECPYCGKTYPIIKQLREKLGDRLRFVFRHFPLNNVHRHAGIAAQAAEAAAGQGKFWAMHDMLYEHQEELADIDIVRFALRIGLEVYQFQADLSADRHAGKVLRDYEGGVVSGVSGTPALFVNGKRYRGPIAYEPLLAAVESALPRSS